jgi:hypothetical protein
MTPLFERSMAFDQGNAETYALMRKVWTPTPWMVDAYTGGGRDREREREMLVWCYDTIGEMASPIHDKPGRWQRGSATVCGWTWFGFTTEADMQAFVARWPAPDGVGTP